MDKEKSASPVYLRIKKAFKDAVDADIVRAINNGGGKVGKSAFSQWKSGNTEPSTDNLLVISKLTGVPLDVLNGEREFSSEEGTESEGGSASGPMTFDRFIAELRALGVEDFHSLKSMKGLEPHDMEEILNFIKSVARTAAQSMIKQRVKDKTSR